MRFSPAEAKTAIPIAAMMTPGKPRFGNGGYNETRETLAIAKPAETNAKPSRFV